MFYSISLSEVSGITGTWYLFIQPASINHPISVRTHAGSRKRLLNANKEWVCVNLSLRMPAVSNYSCPGRGVSGPGTGVLRFYSPSVCSHHAPWRQMVKTSFQQNPRDHYSCHPCEGQVTCPSLSTGVCSNSCPLSQ